MEVQDVPRWTALPGGQATDTAHIVDVYGGMVGVTGLCAAKHEKWATYDVAEPLLDRRWMYVLARIAEAAVRLGENPTNSGWRHTLCHKLAGSGGQPAPDDCFFVPMEPALDPLMAEVTQAMTEDHLPYAVMRVPSERLAELQALGINVHRATGRGKEDLAASGSLNDAVLRRWWEAFYAEAKLRHEAGEQLGPDFDVAQLAAKMENDKKSRLEPSSAAKEPQEVETRMATKNLNEAGGKSKVHVAEVVRHGTSVQLPENMTLDDAIKVLMRRKQFEDETMEFREVFDCFIWDGAYALSLVLEAKFGWAAGEWTRGDFFNPPEPPKTIGVAIAVDRVVNVPWGDFSVPGVEGRISTGHDKREGRFVFALSAVVKRKYEATVRALADDVRKVLRDQSIYKGKAIKLRFRDDEGEVIPMPTPTFLDLRQVREDELVFPADVERAVATNLFTPVEKRELCRQHGVPFKRGVLLAGDYGTGKTLAAHITASKAVRHGVTYIYAENINDFHDVVRFAAQYSPAIVFCEDIDRVVRGDRSIRMDQILNIIDGIESKRTEVMVVLTTNNVEEIHQAMIRPGRLDAVIHVKRPDSVAVERLVRLYARGRVADGEDLSAVGRLLDGQIPAVVREVVERAKLATIRGLKDGETDLHLTGSALAEAAETMKMQLDLLARKQNTERSDAEVLGHVMGQHLRTGIERLVENLTEEQGEAYDRLRSRGKGVAQS